MRIALVSFGSLGDVQPLLAVARALQSLGHQPVVLTNPAFRVHAEKAGVTFIPVGSETDYESTINHPKVWHPVDGLGVMWRYLLRPALRPTFEKLTQLHVSGQLDLVLASPIAMGARIAQESSGLPLVTLYTAATMLRSCMDPLTIANLAVPSMTPMFVRRAVWRILDSFKLDPLVTPSLEDVRRDLGLKPIRSSIFGNWVHSPLACWALFPDWFARASDWPSQLLHIGFPYIDQDSGEDLKPDLERFLASGSRPIVFAPGTAARGGSTFYTSAVQACQQLGARGVLLGDAPEAMVSEFGDQFWCGSYVSFPRLLPQSLALVHHGGIGTLAQGLRAGVPQVAVPSGYDQFDNAHRLRALGVGEICLPHQLPELSRVISRTLRTERANLDALARTSVSLQSIKLSSRLAHALGVLKLPAPQARPQ